MKNQFNRPFILFSVVLVAIGGLLIAAASNGWFNRDFQNDQTVQAALQVPGSTDVQSFVPPKQLPLNEALKLDDDEMVMHGGIIRPKRDLAFEKSPQVGKTSEKSLFQHPGHAPAIPKDTNEEVAGLFEELASEDGGPLAARSSLFAPEPFDQKSYDADKAAYLQKIRPGRVFQPAQPGPDVTPIGTESKVFQNILQGDKVHLTAMAEPGSPVTFWTGEVGEFDNRLTSQTVEANTDGIAQVAYTATTGTNGLVSILAASPVNSGQIRFRLRVSLPETN